MTPPFHLDPPTLVVANLVTSVATVLLLLITRFGLGASGSRMDGWIAGECVLLVSRVCFPLLWLLEGFGWQIPAAKIVLPLIVIGLSWHVVGLRQARTGAARPDMRSLAVSAVAVILLVLFAQFFQETVRMRLFVVALAVVWGFMLWQSVPLARHSWGGRGLVVISAVTISANVVLSFTLDPSVSTVLYGPGLLIESVVILLATSCYLLWVQEDLRGHLTTLATMDALTGVMNRHGLMPRLEHELALARSSGHPLSIVIYDLDHFKQVNDTYGHATGDQVLQSFAARALRATRRHDKVGRWGGEEFLLVLPNTGLADAALIADRLRKTCADAVSRDNQQLPTVTVSAGVASTSEGSDFQSLPQLLAHADKRLYMAKASRNCIASQDEPGSSPVSPSGVAFEARAQQPAGRVTAGRTG
jgi:diguanylate cyclase (GGDEF)-like protein